MMQNMLHHCFIPVEPLPARTPTRRLLPIEAGDRNLPDGANSIQSP
jgi:hypothetical protein